MKNFKPLSQKIASDIARGILTVADFQVYCWLLLNCDWRDYSIRTSAPCIAEALGRSVQKVRRSLQKLCSSGWLSPGWRQGLRGPYAIAVHIVPRQSGRERRSVTGCDRRGDGRSDSHFSDENRVDSGRRGEPRGDAGGERRAAGPPSLDNRSIDNRGGRPPPSHRDEIERRRRRNAPPRSEGGAESRETRDLREHWRKACPLATNITDAVADDLFLEARSAGIAPQRMHELIDEHRRLTGDRGAAPWRILREELRKVRSQGRRTQPCPMCREGAIEYIVQISDGVDFRRLRCPCYTGEVRATRGAKPLSGLPLLGEVFPLATRRKWGIVVRNGCLHLSGKDRASGDFGTALVWDEEAARPARKRDADGPDGASSAMEKGAREPHEARF